MQQTFVAGATQATSASDYALLLSTAATDPETIAQLVARGRADGVILMETLLEDPRVERLQAAGYPFALIGRTRDMTGISYVDMDFGDAIETSLAHLARLGHTCVALFNFPPDLLEAGYTAALIARDVFEQRAPDLGIRGIHIPCSHAPREAFAVAAQLLRSEPECTAAITTGWQFTGLLSALRAADLYVPEDFSIVSVIASQFAEMLTPSLTGVEWPAFDAGPDGGRDAHRAAHGAEPAASAAPDRRRARRQGFDRTGPPRTKYREGRRELTQPPADEAGDGPCQTLMEP